jgi:hypothetical protein
MKQVVKGRIMLSHTANKPSGAESHKGKLSQPTKFLPSGFRDK